MLDTFPYLWASSPVALNFCLGFVHPSLACHHRLFSHSHKKAVLSFLWDVNRWERTEQVGKWRGKVRQMDAQLGIPSCNYYVGATASGLGSDGEWCLVTAPWGTGARSREEPVFLGEALRADLVWPLCGLGCEHIVPMLAVPLEWDLWKCTEEITLKGSWWECSLMAFLRILFWGKLKGCESSV